MARDWLVKIDGPLSVVSLTNRETDCGHRVNENEPVTDSIDLLSSVYSPEVLSASLNTLIVTTSYIFNGLHAQVIPS